MNPNELFQDIKGIRTQLEQLSQRPLPASAEQVQQLADKPITVTASFNTQEVADLLRSQLGDPSALRQAADAAAELIRRSGQEAAEQIRQAAAGVPRRVSVSGDVYGFTSWQSVVAILGVFGVLFFGVGWYARYQADQAQYWQQQATQTAKDLYDYQHFVEWLKEQKSYQGAFKQYNQQVNEGEKKQ